MPAFRDRASALACAALAAAALGCAGDARRVDPPPALTLRIGTFLGKEEARLLPFVFSAEPLVAVGWDGRPVYRLAENVKQSADGLTLTVTLRHGVTFHNGAKMTAGEVSRLLLAKKPAIAAIDAIDAKGDDTVVIRLARPNALKVVDLSDYTIHDAEHPDVRTGPFRIVSTGTPTVLQAFSGYYQGTPTVSRLEIQEYPSRRAAWTAMMRGEVNVLHEVNPDAIDFIEEGGSIRAYPLLRPYYVSLLFNLKHPVLQRREVRLALGEAVNREDIVRTALRGHGVVAEGPFWPYHWAYPRSRYAPAENVLAARARLDGAGLTVQTHGRSAMPSRFGFTCLLPRGDARFERIALVVQRQLFELGIDMRIRLQNSAELEARLMSGDFEAAIFDVLAGRTLGWVQRFWHSPAVGARPVLANGYSGADSALDRLRSAESDDEVRIAVADVMRALREDPPAVFLVWREEARAVDRGITIPYEQQRDIFGWLWQAQRGGDAAAR